METVAVVSPGAMGSAMADALARGGARVVATLAHRSERTGRLADAAPLELLPDLDAVVREADVVLSIVPPETARVVAEDIAHAAREQGVSPVLVDLNAIAPATVRALADGGLELVDGSISGPPPWKPGTRVYRTASSSTCSPTCARSGRARRERRAQARVRGDKVGPIRRRDARDRRDPASGRSHVGALRRDRRDLRDDCADAARASEPGGCARDA